MVTYRLERVLLEVYRGRKKKEKRETKIVLLILRCRAVQVYEIHHQVEKSERPREIILFI